MNAITIKKIVIVGRYLNSTACYDCNTPLDDLPKFSLGNPEHIAQTVKEMKEAGYEVLFAGEQGAESAARETITPLDAGMRSVFKKYGL